ncbi:MAG TPA: aspartate aminotransferase family protein [Deltaproteobacteria bacterium]|nr:aspartate aminotransferase family protein [Deltaproteobacteria bacterium]
MKKADGSHNRARGLFDTAEKVFSRSYVNLLREKGHDVIEQEGDGSWMTDAQGGRYLDCYASAGTYNLGRRNRAIARRFMKAVHETDQGNFVMPSDYKALLAQRIASFVPGRLDCVLFGVTRGESMDAACRLARGATSRPGIVTVDGGCYGETGFALSLTAKAGKEQFGGLIPEVLAVPFGDEDAALRAVTDRTAAFVMEPIQAENHCRESSREYALRIRRLCDATKTVLIFDETQTGFGRTGTRFFFEQLGVEPDILVIGEAVTSGMFPMTAMVFTPELKRFFDIHPLIHLCTFGGHDLGCVVAMAALDEYELAEPWVNARMMGQRLASGLHACAQEFPDKAASVAGRGLLFSLRLAGGEPAAKAFCARAMREGLLVETGRVDTSTVLFRPSLLVSEDEVDRIVQAVRTILAGL